MAEQDLNMTHVCRKLWYDCLWSFAPSCTLVAHPPAVWKFQAVQQCEPHPAESSGPHIKALAPRICSRCASRTAMTHKSTSRPQTYLQYVLSSSTIFQRLWMHTDQTYPCSAAKGWRAHCIVWRTHPWPQPMQDQLNYYTRSKLAVRGNNPKCVNFIEFHWISDYCAVTESCSWHRHAVPQSALHYTLPDYTALICHDNSIHDDDLVWCWNPLIYLSFRCLYVLDVW